MMLRSGPQLPLRGVLPPGAAWGQTAEWLKETSQDDSSSETVERGSNRERRPENDREEEGETGGKNSWSGM